MLNQPAPAVTCAWLCVLLCVPAAWADMPADTEEQTPPPADTTPLEDMLQLDMPTAPPRATPDTIELSPLVTRLLEDELTDDAERTRLRIFHGQWSDLDADALTPDRRARLALLRYELDDPIFADEQVDALLRGEAALLRGEPEVTASLLEEIDSARAALLRARALEDMGRTPEAVEVLVPWRERLQNETITDAGELTAATEALLILARLEGRPAQDYRTARDLYTRVRQDIDPLYWPAIVAEGELLVEKDNRPEAAQAFQEALVLNPRSSRAWYLLGRLTVDGYNFAKAQEAVDALRQINETHVLADILEARSLLQQKDVAAAREVIETGLSRHPTHRELTALLAASYALAYDEDRMRETLARLEELAPGSALGPFTVGYYLSLARQYDDSEKMLRAAVERQPNDAAPRVELGLLLMQAGRNEPARIELREASRLDPFHRRAANSLKLVEELLDYQTIETEHFTIRYLDGIDAVLAHDMPDQLEQMYREVTGAYEHKPANKTEIDLLPDEQAFGVRITGMPEIWTIAASTGDVIALTPPRYGARQRGTFDWLNVTRHEFTHTVTLSLTRNRIPHWFTEAAAVNQELTERGLDDGMLLADALLEDELFDLTEINWGFIRPKTPRDRPLAYAQAAWMLQFITERFGHRAVLDMLDLYAEGEPELAAIEQVTGLGPDQFMSEFRQWAHGQVEQWGVAKLRDEDALEAGENGPDMNHPLVLRKIAADAVERDTPESALRAVTRYAAAVPIDPWPQRQIARLALQLGRTDQAIAAMEYLDRQETSRGDWARQLAKLYRQSGDLDAAYDAIIRALRREPYNPADRETAATIALQRSDTDAALRHITDLTLLEPDRAIHYVRLAALYDRLGLPDDARAAAERAQQLDPQANVSRFLD